MSLAVVHTRALVGLSAPEVRVEVHLGNGLPAFHIVGLPQAAVRESADRVRAALLHCGFEFPNRRLTVNLAPADLPKDSGRFDLPIAVGILAASGQVPVDALAVHEFVTEAKGKAKVGLAELEAGYKPTTKTHYQACVAKAEANYVVAKERCDDLAGNAKARFAK